MFVNSANAAPETLATLGHEPLLTGTVESTVCRDPIFALRLNGIEMPGFKGASLNLLNFQPLAINFGDHTGENNNI